MNLPSLDCIGDRSFSSGSWVSLGHSVAGVDGATNGDHSAQMHRCDPSTIVDVDKCATTVSTRLLVLVSLSGEVKVAKLDINSPDLRSLRRCRL